MPGFQASGTNGIAEGRGLANQQGALFPPSPNGHTVLQEVPLFCRDIIIEIINYPTTLCKQSGCYTYYFSQSLPQS